MRLASYVERALTDYASHSDSLAWTTLRDGSRLRVDLRNRTQARTYWTGEYDWPLMRRLLELVEPGHSIVDVGANVGLYAVPFARKLRTGRLWCFEPLAANLDRLRENLAANGVLEVASTYRLALGAASGDVELQRERGSPTGNAAVVDSGATELTERVPVERLDDAAKRLGIEACHLLKVDTEGGELDVLRGGRELLERHRPVVVAELNRYWMGVRGWTADDLGSFADELGYDLAGDRSGAPAAKSFDNVLLVPRGTPLGERARSILRG